MTRLVTSLLAVLILGAVVGASSFAAELSDDSEQRKKLDSINRARQLFLTGEEANKEGNLIVAVICWATALELKPDSDYTRKCLKTAREKIYKTYLEYVKKNDPNKDLVTAYVDLKPITILTPDNKDLHQRLAAIEAKLSENQNKALDGFKRAIKLAGNQEYAKAQEEVKAAQILDPNAVCLRELDDEIGALMRSGTAGAVRSSNPGILKLVYIGADWCRYCREMRPRVYKAREMFPGQFELIEIDSVAQPEIARSYNYQAIPTMIFYKDGKEALRIPGAVSMEDFLTVLVHLGVRIS